MEEKLYSNFIERIESDCFEVGNGDSINFTPEKGFSSFLQCELIFPT